MSHNIRLLQIVPSLNSGGVEIGTIDIAKAISDSGNFSAVASNGGRLVSLLKKNGSKHFDLPVGSKNPFIMYKNCSKLKKLLINEKINIMHIRSRAPAWPGYFAGKGRVKLVSTFHNIYGHENFIKKFYNKALSKTDYIVAISNYVREEIIKNYQINPNKIKVINRGVDLDFYDGKPLDEKKLMNFLNQNYISPNYKTILYPGRLTEWKGQIQFLNIIEKLKDKPYIFYFVGDNKNSNYTKNLIQQIKIKNLDNNCKIMGHFDKENLKMMYYCSDLVISMPLKPEGFGRIISESIAMNKIIIANNIGGAKNQLENLDDIYKIDTNESDKIVDKINFILETPLENFEKLKFQSREYIVNNFSKKQMLENYFNLYMDIIN